MVFQTSMLNWRGFICYGYMCIVLYMKLIWCNGFAEIYAQLEEGALISMGIFSIYIERSAIRCSKFGVAVFKASLLE